jgi:hypothetical protein
MFSHMVTYKNRVQYLMAYQMPYNSFKVMVVCDHASWGVSLIEFLYYALQFTEKFNIVGMTTAWEQQQEL